MNTIRFFYENISLKKVRKRQLKKNIQELIVEEGLVTGNISVIFCNDEYLLEINSKYLNHHYYTDIITFNYCNQNIISGDLFISLDRVKENAISFKVKEEVEIQRVVFHGVLHLLGYNDKSVKEKRKMREKEDYYLDKFSIQNM